MVKKRAEKRRQQVLEAGGSFSSGDLLILRVMLFDRCAYCDSALHGGGVVDHMQPVSRGGSSSLGNLTLCCSQCNQEKHAKTVEEYRVWRVDRGLATIGYAFLDRR